MKHTINQEDKTSSAGLVKDDDDPGESITHPIEGAVTEKKDANNGGLFKRFRGRLNRLFSFKNSNNIEREVAELIEEHDPEGLQISEEERSILNNVLSIGESKVHNVMIPRTDIVAVECSLGLEEIKQTLINKEHTRMPVYRDSLDNVIGFMHIKDLIPFLGSGDKFSIKNVTRKILYVPPSMKVVDLLVRMRSERVHMALVLDEYGGTDGLVTMEDLMEEIVGEIEDEHDEIVQTNEIKKISEGVYEVNARVSVQDLDERLNSTFKKEDENEDYDTVGGLVFFMLGHVPEKGEEIEHPSGYLFKVIEADDRRVKKIIVSKK
jgi:magnesium and cobalt transporter